MNSDKAAAVRDAVNGCPDVVTEEAVVECDGEPFREATGAGPNRTQTGDYLKPRASAFRPAYIEQSGTVGNGEGREKPVFVVVLEALWLNHDTAHCLSPELVYEVAKHECGLRFYPPEHRLGSAVWIVDHFADGVTDTDGDRCPDCEGTYWKVRDGEPECARCGTPLHGEQPAEQPTVEDYT
jgi:hypothetical protein